MLSLLLGLASGSHFPALLVRALVFSLIFFALFCIIFRLAGQFVPELFSGVSAVPGRMTGGLDIPSGQETAGVPSASSGQALGAFPLENFDETGDEVDNIEGKVFASLVPGVAQQDSPPDEAGVSPFSVSGGLDQGEKEEYTAKAAAGARSAGDDTMPDFDALSAAFSSNSGTGQAGQNVEMEVLLDSAEMKKTSRGKGKDALEGDFSPKELAQAVQTVLKKDEQKG